MPDVSTGKFLINTQAMNAKLRKTAKTYWRIVRSKDFDFRKASKWLHEAIHEFGYPALRKEIQRQK